MLSLVMKNTKMKKAKVNEIEATMAGIIQWVANYTGEAHGIGYSYFYYANEMYINDNIKLLAINGIEPTFETIQDESYPLMSAYYIVTRKYDPNDNIQKLKEAILSIRGKQITKDAGYIPLP